jgi:energy-coupling factor transporter ATP-binding protein EcfA2
MSGNEYLLSYQRQLCDQLALAIAEICAGGNSIGVLLLGASGSGKTTTFDALQRRNLESIVDGQPVSPMCRIQVPTSGDATSIVAQGLLRLGKPVHRPADMKLRTLEPDFEAALRSRRVRIVALEEAHNAMLSGDAKFRGQTARFIKNLWNGVPRDSPRAWGHPDAARGDWRLAIVLSATDELFYTIWDDLELRSRFPIIIRAPTLGFEPPELFREFRDVLIVILSRYGLVSEGGDDDGEIAVRAMLACSGHLRVLDQLARRASTICQEVSHKHSLNESLALAFESLTLASRLSGNPFRLSAGELAEQYAVAKRIQPARAKVPSRPKKSR